MSKDFDQLKIGYKLSESNIAHELTPILDETVESYKRHHSDLTSVYVIGSVALGEWRRGISDIDTIGVSQTDILPEEDQARRDELAKLGENWDDVTFIDNTVISMLEIKKKQGASTVNGHLSKLALSGVRIWGNHIDFSDHMPSMHDMTYGRTRRAQVLMQKYRSGNLIEPFQKDPRLLTRSSAKAAMRVLSSMTLLRGAVYHSSPYRTSEDLEHFVPEAVDLNKRTLEIIDNPIVAPEVAMEITDHAIQTFYTLFPVDLTNGS